MVKKVHAISLVFILLASQSVLLTSGVNNQTGAEHTISSEILSFGPRLSEVHLPASLSSQITADLHEGHHTLLQTFSFDPSSCSVHKAGDTTSYVEIGDLLPYTRPLCPIVPMKTYTFLLPKEAESIEITLTDVYFRQVETSLTLRKAPIPRFWTQDKDEENNLLTQFLSSKLVDTTNQFYPGNTIH